MGNQQLGHEKKKYPTNFREMKEPRREGDLDLRGSEKKYQKGGKGGGDLRGPIADKK